MSFVSVAEVRDKIQTDLDDTRLLVIIANEEAALTARLGAPPDGATTVTEAIYNTDGGTLYLKRPVTSITSVHETITIGDTASALVASDYYLIAARGQLVRLASGVQWGQVATVVYVPGDSAALWKQVIIELIRISIQQTAMEQESVAQEYSYKAPDWNVARQRQYRRLEFPAF